MTTMSSNLTSMAKSLEEAQNSSDKLGKKGGKASAQKVDAAAAKLESASQQWDSQAPYIFESLQALDESRINQLRDLLTQYQTHEADCAQRTQEISADALAQVIEVSTEAEILGFSNKVTAGRARLPTRESTRRSSAAETQNSNPPPGTAGSTAVPPAFALQAPPEETETAEQPTLAAPEPKPEPPVEPKPGEHLVSYPATWTIATNRNRIQITPPRYHLWWASTTECSRRHRTVSPKDWLVYFWAPG